MVQYLNYTKNKKRKQAKNNLEIDEEIACEEIDEAINKILKVKEINDDENDINYKIEF